MSLIKRQRYLGITDITKGTPADPSTGDGLIVEEFTPPAGDRNIITNDNEMGAPIQTRSCPTDHPEQTASYKFKWGVEGTKPMELLYAVMGGTYAHVADSPEAGANTTTMDLIAVLNDPIWKTVAYDEGDEVKALEESVVKSVLFEIDESVLKCTVTHVGTKWDQQSTFTNTVTFDDPEECFVFGKAANYCRLADNDAATLTVTDNQTPNGMSILIERGFIPIDPTIGTFVLSDEIEDLPPKVTVTLSYPKKDTGDNKNFLAEHYNQTPKMIEILLTGGDIAGTLLPTPYSILFQFPDVRLLDAPTYSTDTPIPTEGVFTMFQAASAPTPMPGVLLPRVTIVNTAPDLGY